MRTAYGRCRQPGWVWRPVYKTVDTCCRRVPRDHSVPLLLRYEFRTRRPSRRSSPAGRGAKAQGAQSSAPGPNRIGQGYRVRLFLCPRGDEPARGGPYETVMVNCNPETVSTDYDTLRPALLRATDLLRTFSRSTQAECASGDVGRGDSANWGGQTPLKLARRLAEAGPTDRWHLGRRAIHLAEGPGSLLGKYWKPPGWRRRDHGIARSFEQAEEASPTRSATPVLVRPSYVFGADVAWRSSMTRSSPGRLHPNAPPTSPRNNPFAGGTSFLEHRDRRSTSTALLATGGEVYLGGVMEAHRGSGHPLRRLRPATLPADHPQPPATSKSLRAPIPRPIAGRAGRAPAMLNVQVRAQGRHVLCPGGQPESQPNRGLSSPRRRPSRSLAKARCADHAGRQHR